MDTKRTFDVVSASCGLLVTAPIFIAIALAIKAEDGGPIFFRQQRVGLHGKFFKIHKFRSMRVSGTGPLVTGANDPRITKIGVFLRKSKLDELPQLIDVLVGNMSIVGPRPEVEKYVRQWGKIEAKEILSVRPGISDPASIAYRNEQDELAVADDPEKYYVEQILPRKVRMYLRYVRNHSFSGDMKLIFQTLTAVLRD